MDVICSGSTYWRSLGRTFIGWLAITWAVCCITTRSHAEDLSESGIETVPYRSSITPSRYLTVRGIPDPEATAVVKATLSYLDQPLSVVIPTAEPKGTSSDVVAGALVFELAVARYWSNGLDLGLSLGAHLYQFGDGWSAVSGEDKPLPHFGGLDPMLEVGYRWVLGRTGLRALGALYVPLGSPQAFTGEKRARGEVGLSVNQLWPRVEWGTEFSFLYRPLIDSHEFSWGSQLKVALAGRFRIMEQLWAGPEFLFRPQLASQPDSHAVLLPNLLLAALEYRSQRALITASYGIGLPLNHISDDISKPRYVRAPTTPIQHASLNVQLMLD